MANREIGEDGARLLIYEFKSLLFVQIPLVVLFFCCLLLYDQSKNRKPMQSEKTHINKSLLEKHQNSNLGNDTFLKHKISSPLKLKNQSNGK